VNCRHISNMSPGWTYACLVCSLLLLISSPLSITGSRRLFIGVPENLLEKTSASGPVIDIIFHIVELDPEKSRYVASRSPRQTRSIGRASAVLAVLDAFPHALLCMLKPHHFRGAQQGSTFHRPFNSQSTDSHLHFGKLVCRD
jgi:hypothetical protein